MAWKKGTATNYLDFIDKIESFCIKKSYVANLAAGSNTGTGTVYGASATDNSVEETWTLICTTPGGNGTAIFSVTGSVSGAKATATCGVPYSIAETSFTILNGTVNYAISDSFTFKTTKPVTATAPVAGANVGNGTAGTVIPVAGSPDETWTIKATSIGPAATFSVVGSVSGAQSVLTSGTPYSNAFFSLTITDGGTAFAINDSFTFSIAGYSQYDVKRGNSTGGNLSNDYLTMDRWEVLGGNTCINQPTLNGSGSALTAPITGVNDTDFSLSFWMFAGAMPTGDGRAFLSLSASGATASPGVVPFYTNRYSGTLWYFSGYDVNKYFESKLFNWTHIVFTYNRTTRESKLYQDNGTPQTWTQTLANAFSNTLNRLTVGIHTQGGSQVVAHRDIQIYNKILSAGEVSTIYGGGTTTGLVHRWLCNEGAGIRYAVDSVGGATYNLDLGPTKKDLILMGKGSGGDSEIYTGIQSYSDAVSKYNLAVNGFTGYTPSNTFATQPGAISTAPAACLQNSAFNYYIHTTPNRIFLFANAGGNDESAYLGWYIPYFAEDQWGYPMAIGGSATSTAIAGNDITTAHKAWFNLATTLQMLANGVWGSVNTSTPMSMNNFSGTNHVTDINGTYPDFEFIPFSTSLGLYFGPFEGVSIPVRANTINSGDVLLDTAKAKLVIGDTFRTGQGTIAAIELSGD